MKKHSVLAIFALATACNSNPRYNAADEYRDLQFNRCIENIPEDQREKNTSQCALTAHKQIAFAKTIYDAAWADRDYKDCLANNFTPENMSECYGTLQREYYDMQFKVPSSKTETYKLAAIYEMKLPEGWLLQKKSGAIQKVNGIKRLEEPVEEKSSDFIAKKSNNSEYLLLRIFSEPGAPAPQSLANISSADFNALKEKKLNELKAKWNPENAQVSEFKANKEQFSGRPALRVECTIQTPDGSRFFDIEYTIHSPSATITAGISQNISKENLDRAKSEQILAGLHVLAK